MTDKKVEVKDVVCDYGVFEEGSLFTPVFNIKSNAEMVRKIVEADNKKIRLDDYLPDLSNKHKEFEVIQAITEVLSKVKGFETGFTSKVNNKFIIDYLGDRFIVKIKPIEKPNPNMFTDIDQYLK